LLYTGTNGAALDGAFVDALGEIVVKDLT